MNGAEFKYPILMTSTYIAVGCLATHPNADTSAVFAIDIGTAACYLDVYQSAYREKYWVIVIGCA